MNEKLEESAKEIIEKLKERGLDGDVFGVNGRNIEYGIKKGELTDSSEYDDVGLGIRVLKDGRLGFGFCTPGYEEKGVKQAVEFSKVSQKIDLKFPEEERGPKIKTFDNKIEDLIYEGKGADFTQELIDGCVSYADDITPTMGGVEIYVGDEVVANTNGLFLEKSRTAMLGSVMATIPGEETSITASEKEVSKKCDIDFKSVGVRSAEKVDSMREQVTLPDDDIPVMVESRALNQLLGFGLIPSFNGENVRKGKSVYSDKLGKEVAHSHLTLKDDPTVDWGIGSSPFDDEGVVSHPLEFISDGILKGFMYDLKEAHKSETDSTGSAIRANFKSPPDISERNLILRGKDIPRKDLLPEGGILVDDIMGAHTANPASGDFSIVANPVWLIEDGEKNGRVEGVMLSGNLPELLKTIRLADDHKRTYMSIGGRSLKMDTPSARVDEIMVSGK
ncbi:MAG: TldD/PmbA family protein [Candidatus Saliniplasma sp.]